MARAMKDSGIEWIGEIPAGWGTNTAFQLFIQVKNKNEGLKEQNLLSLSYGKIKRKSIETVSGLLPESFDGYNIIEPDDIVLRLTDLQNDQKSLRVGLSPERGIVTSAYLTLRNRSTSLPKYLYYYLHAFDISKGFYGMGAGVRQGLNWDGLKWLKILTPPVSEQKKIVSLLDGECARIDAVIEQTRASIEEYKKLKQSVITQAVTKGIRPDRKMKDSGVEWIGEIPEEWSINPLGKGLELIQTGPFGSQLHADEYINNGIVVVNPANISNGEIIPDEKCTITREKAQELSRHMLKMGDIVFGRRGEMGRSACVIDSSHEYFCGTGCLQIRCNEALKPRYASYYLQNPCIKQYLELHAVGTTMQNLNTTIVSGIPIVYGTPSEQEEIVDYIDCKRAEIDQLICAKQQFLSELESYKKSLIFEYVTGKKET